MMTLGKDFLYFRFGQFLALLGGRCSFLALSWWLLDKSGSKEQFSHAMLVFSVVGLIATPLFSPFAERWSRRGCALLSDGWSLVILLALFVMVNGDLYQPSVIMLLIAAFALGGAMMNSTSASIVPMLVPHERLVEAFGIIGSLQSLALIFGALLAGTVVKSFGMGSTLLFNMLLLVVTLWSTTRIRTNTSSPHDLSPNSDGLWLPSLISGTKLYLALRLEFGWGVIGGIINGCFIPFVMLMLPIFVRESLRLDIVWYAILNASIATGLLLSSWTFVKQLNRRISPAVVTILGVLLIGSGILSFVVLRNPYFLIIASLLIGVGMGMHNVNCSAYRTIAVPGRYRARISGWGKWLSQGLTPMGIMMFGFVINRIENEVALLVAGSVILLTGSALALLPGFTALMGGPVQSRENFYEALYPEAFRSESVAAKQA